MVSVDEMLYAFILERGTIDAVFILRRLQEESHAKGKKLYMHFVDLEKDLTEYQGMRKELIPVVLVRSVMREE